MALEISKKDDAKLTIQGTSIELDSIYARIELASAANGKDMQMGMYYYENEASFKANNGVLRIAEMNPLYSSQVDTSKGETQTILIASEQVKEALETQGYTVTIVDL